ncbi:MAG: hypothetical protein CL398_02030 [Acidiferrobacteraceae bacterium]|nr:hypothetical protein [Acidiferrobacteraceae bacterium]
MNSKNILLIPPTADKSTAQDMWLSPNLGIVRIANYLNSKGHYAEFFDVNIHQYLEDVSLEDKLRERKWDIVGFSTLDETLLRDLQHMHLAKKLCPDSLFIAGGLEAQSNYQTILDKSPCKIVVLGEGELPMLSIADGHPLAEIPGIVFRNDANILTTDEFREVTSAIDWESLPYETYWDFYVKKYQGFMTEEVQEKIHTVRIFTRNRCPFKCFYCDAQWQLGKATGNLQMKSLPVVSLDVDHIMHLVERIVKSHPRVKTIYFTDDDFCFNKKFLREFCRKAIELNFPVKYMCFSRITDLREDTINLMKEAKFRNLNIGVESFSDHVLKEINKKCTAKDVHRGIALLDQYKLKAYFNLILFTPGTTIDDVEETVDQGLRYTTSDNFTAGIIPAIIPLKGSPFFETTTEYATNLEKVPDTEHLIKKHRFIYASDPIARELQVEYIANVGSEVEKYKIVHKETENLALIQLKFAKKLIDKKRAEYGIKKQPRARIVSAT